MVSPSPTPSTERLVDLVHAMADQPVLVVADLVADRFITGSPKRISREAPVLILQHESETTIPGGGANAVANVAALGGQPLTVGVVGDDPNGEALIEELRHRGVSTDNVIVRPGYRTPTKTRILGGGKHAIKQQIVRYDIEDRAELGADEIDDARQRIRSLASGAHEGTARGPHDPRPNVAILSDYGYGTVDPLLLAAVREAVGKDGLILCDSRYRLPEFRGADGATPNEEETEAILGPLDDQRLARERSEIFERLGLRFLLVTRGSHGMTLLEADAAAHLPVHGTDQVADVTGAGDTVIGTFALALAAGATRLEAALLANYAGGVVVMKMGTATLTPAELIHAIQTDRRPLEQMTWVST